MRLAPWRVQTRPAPWLVSVSTRVAAWLALAARPLSPPVTLMSIPACMFSIRVSHLITAVCELRGMLSTGEGRASYEYRGEYERREDRNLSYVDGFHVAFAVPFKRPGFRHAFEGLDRRGEILTFPDTLTSPLTPPPVLPI